jgi:23S rRNA (guanosine2251-2'-O)-methyltransferase
VKREKLIFGLRPVIEAVKSGKTLDKILIQRDLKSELFKELRKNLSETGVPCQYVPVEKLNKITRKNHQGVVAYLSSITYYQIEDILPGLFEAGAVPLVLVLDRITDVRNFGAIARTAECAGVDVLIIPSKGSAQINEDAIKTSAGALHKIPVCRSGSLPETINYLKESGLQIIAASEKATNLYYQVDYSKPSAIIMGSEEDGISRAILNIAEHRVYIPVLGKIESMNVSVAAGVIIYEAVRQRTEKNN